MPASPQDFLEHFLQFLTSAAASRSLPLSLLLIGLEALIEQIFLCPCIPEWNAYLIVSIFIGPAIFIFALMVILLRPCKLKYCEDFAVPNEAEDQQTFFKALGHCLIPPVMWVIILFLDGDYLACSLTTWNGTYVSDKELQRNWCQPKHGSVQRYQYQQYIVKSQFCGNVVLAVFSVVMVSIVGLYDRYKIRKCCRRTQKAQSGGIPPNPAPNEEANEEMETPIQ